MGGILSYSGIVTKARAMEARLLSREDYEKIASMESVSDFISFLKGKTNYRELFEGREENSFHRNEIEELLNYSIYQDYAKLYRFCNKEQRKVLELMLWRMEADLLKECLHRTVAGRNPLTLPASAEFLKHHSEVDMEALSQAETIDAYVAALKGSPYERLFEELSENNRLTLHAMEERLDISCFERIWKAIQKNFRGKDKKTLMDVYGKQIDLLNILWLYRIKKYYNNEANEKPEMISVCYKLKKSELTAMAECYSIEDFLHILEKTWYSKIGDGATMEEFYRAELARAYQENQRKYPYSMSSPCSLIYKKLREIDRLTTALECIRYQMDAGMALQYILQG